jgi:CRP/FNR family cyclic AMP-dependent transcriptional regulator
MPSQRREQGVSTSEPGSVRERLRPQASYCYLLDADTDLAQEFDLRMRVVARQAATVVVFEIPLGEHLPTDWLEPNMGGLGLLLLDGVIAVEVQVGDRTATELMGAGDLLQPRPPDGDDLLEHLDGWHVLLPARVAVLDAGFAERARPWPQITLALLRRTGKRACDLDIQRAIASQPRLEVRLALMLWHLATRWGRVELGGIRLSLPLTHRLLGQLVGAERPSVSHALARLAEAELVTGRGDEWHLHGTLEHHLGCLAGRATHVHDTGNGALSPAVPARR